MQKRGKAEESPAAVNGREGESRSLMERFHLRSLPWTEQWDDLAEAVHRGLEKAPKRIPCRFLYDLKGSEIFDSICELPEYYPFRKEHELLETHAQEIADRMKGPVSVVELGSGTAAKTRLLLEAFLERQESLRFIPVDISAGMLEGSSLNLLAAYPWLEVHAIAGEYEEGLRHLKQEQNEPKLILWLGSNLGNLNREEAARFVRRIVAAMQPVDRVLLGIDARKDRAVIEKAYDDAKGVTASFFLNLLERINRELFADFERSDFAYRSRYDEEEGFVEMALQCRRDHVVRIGALGLEVKFRRDEFLYLERSYKYGQAEIEALAQASGLSVEKRWTDRDRWYSLNLLAPAPA